MGILKVVIYTVITCLISTGVLLPQYGSLGSVDARSMGMGKTYTASNRGVHSIGLNPANLILEDSIYFQFATLLPLPTVSAKGGIDVLSLDDINYFFGGVNGNSRVLTENDKQRLNELFKDGGFISASTSAQLLSLELIPDKKIGAFGFAIADYSGGKGIIPAAIIDLVLNGNPVDKVFDFSDAELHSWWIRNYSLSYAKKFDDVGFSFLKDFAAGISVKLVHGFAYAGTEKVGTYITTSDKNEISGEADYIAFSSFSDNFGIEYEFDSTNHYSSFQLFPAPAGTGFGLDLGLSFLLGERTTVSLAITDIGTITWNKNAARFVSEGSLFLDDLTDAELRDSLIDKFVGTAEPVQEFSTGLSTAFRFGAAYVVSRYDEDDFPGYLLIAADYNQGFNNLPGNSTQPRFSFGLEWQILDFLPMIRTGVEYSEVDKLNWALGLGFVTSLLEVHLATSSFQTTFSPATSSIISLSLSSRWKFN